MTKRHYQIDAFKISTERNNYVVTLEHLKNDRNGNPKYKAVIVFIEENTQFYYNAGRHENFGKEKNPRRYFFLYSTKTHTTVNTDNIEGDQTR